MLPQEGGFAIMLQKTGIATLAQEIHVAAALRDKGYTPFFQQLTGGDGVHPHLDRRGPPHRRQQQRHGQARGAQFDGAGPRKGRALEIRTDTGGLTLINVNGPQAGCSPWAGRTAFWADIQMYATARSLGGRHPMVIAGDTNIYMDATNNPATEHFGAGWEVCGFQRATAGGVEDMNPMLHPSRHQWTASWSTSPCCHGPCGRASEPAVTGSDHLPVHLALPGLLNAAGHAAVPTPYSHTEGRLLTYSAEAAHVKRCLWAAVTAAQDEPSLAPWLGPAEQHAYGSMPAAAVDKVFQNLHAALDALARTVGRRQLSPARLDLAGGDPPESGKRLQAAILRYDALAARELAGYQAKAARHGIHGEAALRLPDVLRGASPAFRPATQSQLQEELWEQAAALEEDIGQLRALLARTTSTPSKR